MHKGIESAIGVFDSGLGGLTAVARLMELLPGEDIIYLGDTGRVPYGGRSRETIIKYARQDIGFLMAQDIKAVLVACGTVSTTALEIVAEECAVPVCGVVEPTVARAATVTRNGKIGLIGTVASIRSNAYKRRLGEIAPEAAVYSAACPLLVPLVENGRIRPGDIVIETVVRDYLAPLKEAGIDTLILGCTHYPLLSPVISAFMGPETTLINSGGAAAEYMAAALGEMGLLRADGQAGTYRYYVSDSTEGFSKEASAFLQKDVRGDVVQVNMDSF